jgi:hypothetical protein
MQQQDVDYLAKVRGASESRNMSMALMPVKSIEVSPIDVSFNKIELKVKERLSSNAEMLRLLTDLKNNYEILENDKSIDADDRIALTETGIKLLENLKQKVASSDVNVNAILKSSFTTVEDYYSKLLPKLPIIEEPLDKRAESPCSSSSSSSGFFPSSHQPVQYIKKTQGKTGAEALQEASVPANQGIGETISSDGRATSTQKQGFTPGQAKP